MSNNTGRAISTYIRHIYSIGFSSIMITFFNTNLSLRFYPYIGEDNNGRSQYDNEKGITTTFSYDGASLLYLIAMKILEGEDSEKEIRSTLECYSNTALTFEYKPGQNNQMEAYLTIDKNNETIPFKFNA